MLESTLVMFALGLVLLGIIGFVSVVRWLFRSLPKPSQPPAELPPTKIDASELPLAQRAFELAPLEKAQLAAALLEQLHFELPSTLVEYMARERTVAFERQFPPDNRPQTELPIRPSAGPQATAFDNVDTIPANVLVPAQATSASENLADGLGFEGVLPLSTEPLRDEPELAAISHSKGGALRSFMSFEHILFSLAALLMLAGSLYLAATTWGKIPDAWRATYLFFLSIPYAALFHGSAYWLSKRNELAAAAKSMDTVAYGVLALGATLGVRAAQDGVWVGILAIICLFLTQWLLDRPAQRRSIGIQSSRITLRTEFESALIFPMLVAAGMSVQLFGDEPNADWMYENSTQWLAYALASASIASAIVLSIRAQLRSTSSSSSPDWLRLFIVLSACISTGFADALDSAIVFAALCAGSGYLALARRHFATWAALLITLGTVVAVGFAWNSGDTPAVACALALWGAQLSVQYSVILDPESELTSADHRTQRRCLALSRFIANLSFIVLALSWTDFFSPSLREAFLDAFRSEDGSIIGEGIRVALAALPFFALAAFRLRMRKPSDPASHGYLGLSTLILLSIPISMIGLDRIDHHDINAVRIAGLYALAVVPAFRNQSARFWMEIWALIAVFAAADVYAREYAWLASAVVASAISIRETGALRHLAPGWMIFASLITLESGEVSGEVVTCVLVLQAALSLDLRRRAHAKLHGPMALISVQLALWPLFITSSEALNAIPDPGIYLAVTALHGATWLYLANRGTVDTWIYAPIRVGLFVSLVLIAGSADWAYFADTDPMWLTGSAFAFWILRIFASRPLPAGSRQNVVWLIDPVLIVCASVTQPARPIDAQLCLALVPICIAQLSHVRSLHRLRGPNVPIDPSSDSEAELSDRKMHQHLASVSAVVGLTWYVSTIVYIEFVVAQMLSQGRGAEHILMPTTAVLLGAGATISILAPRMLRISDRLTRIFVSVVQSIAAIALVGSAIVVHSPSVFEFCGTIFLFSVITALAGLMARQTRRPVFIHIAQAALAAGYTYARERSVWGDLLDGYLALELAAGAFLFMGIAAWLRGHTVHYAARAFERGAILLPLFIPLVISYNGRWGDTAATLASAGLYAWLSRAKEKGAFTWIAAAAFNLGICPWLIRGDIEPTLAILLPFGVSLLVLDRWAGAPTPSAAKWIRSAGLLLVFGASTFETLQFDGPGPALLLALCSILGILLGIYQRLRSYVELGFAFLMINIVANLGRWGAQDRMIAGVLGVSTGIGLFILGVMIAKNKAKLLAQHRRLRQWNW